MPESHLPPVIPIITIERPTCSTCNAPLMLARIAPGPGFEHRIFECSKCDHVDAVVIAKDPMKSDAIGWLAGELKPPT